MHRINAGTVYENKAKKNGFSLKRIGSEPKIDKNSVAADDKKLKKMKQRKRSFWLCHNSLRKLLGRIL